MNTSTHHLVPSMMEYKAFSIFCRIHNKWCASLYSNDLSVLVNDSSFVCVYFTDVSVVRGLGRDPGQLPPAPIHWRGLRSVFRWRRTHYPSGVIYYLTIVKPDTLTSLITWWCCIVCCGHVTYRHEKMDDANDLTRIEMQFASLIKTTGHGK